MRSGGGATPNHYEILNCKRPVPPGSPPFNDHSGGAIRASTLTSASRSLLFTFRTRTESPSSSSLGAPTPNASQEEQEGDGARQRARNHQRPVGPARNRHCVSRREQHEHNPIYPWTPPGGDGHQENLNECERSSNDCAIQERSVVNGGLQVMDRLARAAADPTPAAGTRSPEAD